MKKHAINLWPYLFIIAAVLLFFFPIFKGNIPFPGDLLVGGYAPYDAYSYNGIAPGGVPNKGQDFDVIRMIFPLKDFTIRSLQAGQIPLWNPYNFSGSPLLAAFQGGVFYPYNIFFLLFSMPFAWTFYIISVPILSAIFTFLLLSEFKFSRKASVFGAIVFAFSSYMVVWMEYGNLGHAGLWLPLALLLIEKNIKKWNAFLGIVLTVVLTLSIFAGYLQISFYLFLFSFAFLIFRLITYDKKSFFKKFLLFLPFFILPLLLGAIQLFPTIQAFFTSARSSYPKSTLPGLFIPIWHFITIAVPDFFGNPATKNYWVNGTYIQRVTYIGVIPLIFVLIGFFSRKKTQVFWFFAVAAGIAYFFSFQNPVSVFIYSLGIPFLSSTVPTRIIYLFCFAASFCAAYGMDVWAKDFKIKNLVPIMGLGVLYLLLWLFVFIIPHVDHAAWTVYLSISERNLILPTFIFIAFCLTVSFVGRFKRFGNFGVWILLFLTLFDLFFFFKKITPFAPASYMYPSTPLMKKLKSIEGINRSWGYGEGYIETNLQTYEKIFSTNGYNPIFIKRYALLVASSVDGRIPLTIPMADVNLAPGYGLGQLSTNPYRQKLMNLLGVKYVIARNNLLTLRQPDAITFTPNIYKLIWQDDPWQIYENTKALPRFFLADNFIVRKGQGIILKIYSKLNLKKTIILEEKPPFQIDKNAHGKAELLSYGNNRVSFETKDSGSQLFFLSDNFANGWKAYLDSKEIKIYRADYSFRAVILPKGKHHLVFVYKPFSFVLGRDISFASILALLVFSIVLKKPYEK